MDHRFSQVWIPRKGAGQEKLVFKIAWILATVNIQLREIAKVRRNNLRIAPGLTFDKFGRVEGRRCI